MLYYYKCPKCSSEQQLIRSVKDRAAKVKCLTENCTSFLKRNKASEFSHITILADRLTTDFGDGEGEQSYSRKDYKDKCKELDREPVGLLWN